MRDEFLALRESVAQDLRRLEELAACSEQGLVGTAAASGGRGPAQGPAGALGQGGGRGARGLAALRAALERPPRGVWLPRRGDPGSACGAFGRGGLCRRGRGGGPRRRARAGGRGLTEDQVEQVARPITEQLLQELAEAATVGARELAEVAGAQRRALAELRGGHEAQQHALAELQGGHEELGARLARLEPMRGELSAPAGKRASTTSSRGQRSHQTLGLLAAMQTAH